MNLELMVRVDGFEFTGGATVVVPQQFYECFASLHVCDDDELADMGFGIKPESRTLERHVKLREDAAKILADHLAHLIVKQMETQDTVNGYKVVKP